MGSEWKRVCVADVCELIVDCVNKTAPVVDYPTPFKMIRTPNVKSGRVTTNDCRFVTEEVFDKWTRRAQVKWGDVLLTREAPLGEVGIVKTHENIFLGQRLMQYRANSKLLDADFLLYSFLSNDLQNQFSMHEGSGSVVSHIRVGDCLKFEINLPSLDEQKRIANVLSSLDKKITLNRQLNQTLEQMAQALFKSWFVDFDPVIDNALAAGNAIPDDLQDRALLRQGIRQQQLAKADHKPLPENIRKLFPSEFELTESLGWVPKGWGEGELQNFGKVITGKTPPSSIENAYSLSGFPFITPTDISEFAYVIEVGRYLSDDGIKSIAKNKIDAGSICVSCIGSQMGKTVLTPVDAYTNQQINSVVLSKKEYRAYLFLNLRSRREEIFALGSSGSTMPILNKSSFERLPILRPSNDVLNEFSVQSSDWLLSILNRSKESLHLAKLRDTLLPKLISGELRIPEAQAQLGEALV